MNALRVYGSKGGVGTTTIAAMLAILEKGTLISPDARAVTGVTDGAGFFTAKMGEGATVRDCGVASPDNPPEGNAVLVVRNCYLSLSRAKGLDLAAFTGVILVEEPYRSLNRSDVGAVLDPLPILAVVEHTAAVSRAVDAGLLATRMPRSTALELAVMRAGVRS